MKKSAFITIFIVIFFFGGQPCAARNKVAFVQEFLEKVCSEQSFTTADEQKFLGERGGYLGRYLHERMSSESKAAYNLQLSPIGLLLQMNKKKISPYSAVMQMAEIDSMLAKQYGGKELRKIYGLSYVLCIFFARKDIMSLDNEIGISIFAVYSQDGVHRIDLPHSIVGGMRLPAALGFVGSDNEYDMLLLLQAWEELRTKCR